jgi:AcrR family transcriptional regulator
MAARDPRRARQRRAVATADAMVTAGEQLLDGRDPDAVSVEEILARAGASASSFYQRFGSKIAFLDHLHDRFCDRIRAEVAAWTDPGRWEGRSLEEAARGGLASYLAFRRAHAGPLRSFEILEGRDAGLMARRRRVDESLARGALACVARLRAADGRAPSPERLRLSLDFAVSTLRSAADGGSRVRAAAHDDDARLVEDLAAALTSYLVGR